MLLKAVSSLSSHDCFSYLPSATSFTYIDYTQRRPAKVCFTN